MPQESPKSAQEGPRGGSGSLKRASRGPRALCAPRKPQEAPREPQKGSGSPKKPRSGIKRASREGPEKVPRLQEGSKKGSGSPPMGLKRAAQGPQE
eukprot:132743-Pyramimonas_sp.AAC.1